MINKHAIVYRTLKKKNMHIFKTCKEPQRLTEHNTNPYKHSEFNSAKNLKNTHTHTHFKFLSNKKNTSQSSSINIK